VLAGLGALEHSQVRRTLGRYQLDRRIAAGGMGEVWAAWDPQLRRELAIKFVRPDRADDGRERDRLLREARALARLTHPNVLAVHDVGEIDGEVFLVTELVAGDTLATRGGPTSDWRALVRLYAQAARGLAAAHTAGLVHRDVKPANLLLGADGRVRVADFGLAVRSNTPSPVAPTEMPSPGASSVITAAGHIAGTPAYMAPEQRAGLGAEGPADQFALCVALGEGIAGRRPPTAPERDALRAFIAERRTIDTQLDELCGVLARGLSLEPEERFPSMTALAEALEEIAGPAPEAIGPQPSGRHRMVSGEQRVISGSHKAQTPASTPDLAKDTDKDRRSVFRLLGLVVLVAAAVAGIVLFATRGHTDDAHAVAGDRDAAVTPGDKTVARPVPEHADGSDAVAPEKIAPQSGSNSVAPEKSAPHSASDAVAPEKAGPAFVRPNGANSPSAANGARPAKAKSVADVGGDRSSPPNTDVGNDLGSPPPPEEDDPVRNGPGMRSRNGDPSAPITMKDIGRAIQRRDGKACRAGLAKLTTPPPTDFRVASMHATCEMVAGNCEGGKREERALAVREGSSPASVEISAELYCDVNDPDPKIRLTRLMRQLSLFTWFECSYYLPAARASAKVATDKDERRQVGIALATIATCYSHRKDCETARKILGEAQAFIPALGVSELNAACR
ncbi:MAG: serine/threonine-protein kinase, partial [Polyangiales bacterium]